MLKTNDYVKLLDYDYLLLSDEFEYRLDNKNIISKITFLKNKETISNDVFSYLDKCFKILKIDNNDITIVYDLKEFVIKEWLIDSIVEIGYMTFEEAMKDINLSNHKMSGKEIKAIMDALE